MRPEVPIRSTGVYAAHTTATTAGMCRVETGRCPVIDIIVIEDQVMLRESLIACIEAQEDMHVVGSAADANDAVDLMARTNPDLVLLDVCTEHDSSGIVAAAHIRAERPDIRIVIMTGMPDITFIDQARRAGADSFIYKNVGTDELLSVIRSTMAGYSTYPSKSAGELPGNVALTETELSILRLFCETKNRKEIAAELYMSEGTLKRHISDILQKTGYDNILRLAVHAVSCGYIVPRIDTPPQADSGLTAPKSGD